MRHSITSSTVLTALRRGAALVATTLTLLAAAAGPATAQEEAAPPSRWEFLLSSGRLVPTGAQRAAIARGGVTSAQLSFVPGPIAVTATLGWARTRDVALEGRPKLHAFFYDLGAEWRAPRIELGGVALRTFGAVGVGARTYDYRSRNADATHNLAGFVSAGGELGVGRVRLRLELRDYVTGFKPLGGAGSSETRNDMVLLAGLRLAARR